MSDSYINGHNKMAESLSLAQSNSKYTLNLMRVYFSVLPGQNINNEMTLFGRKVVLNKNYVPWQTIDKGRTYSSTESYRGLLAGSQDIDILKQSFVEASMDNLHCINPIRHFSLAVVVIARGSKSLGFFYLLSSLSY